MLATIFIYVCFSLCNAQHESALKSTGNCPIGWIDSSDGCFYFHFTEKLSWRKSQLQCQNMGAFLAEPKTAEQQSLLTSFAYVEQSQVGSNSWWIGLTDQGHENRWIWQHSAEDVALSNWAPGTPGYNIGNDCAMMNTDNQYLWTDASCDELLASPICQLIDTLPTVPVPTTTPTGPVPTTTPTGPVSSTVDSDQYYVELRGGNETAGNVFAVNRDGYLGPICDDDWFDSYATIVCKQLGFFGGERTRYSQFGDVPSDFAMDEVSCNGDEEHIQDCEYITSDDCAYDEGAGVICQVDGTTTEVPDPTTTPTLDMYHVELRGGNETAGNVFAVNRDGYLGPICDDDWYIGYATIVCKQLGYSRGSRTRESYFGDVPSNFAMDDVECDGGEPHIQNCRYITNDNCDSDEGAGVICYTDEL